MVEFVIVLPLLVLLVICTIQLGRLLSQGIWTANNNYESVRTGLETSEDFREDAMRRVFDVVIRQNYINSGTTRASNELGTPVYQSSSRSVSAFSSGVVERIFDVFGPDINASYTGAVLLSSPDLEAGDLDEFRNFDCGCGAATCYYNCDGECVTIAPSIPCNTIGRLPPPPGCFAGDTSVTMADGSQKPIRAVRRGDLVLAFDQRSGRKMPGRVAGRIARRSSEHLLINGSLRVTGDHRFYLPEKKTWRAIRLIGQGEQLLTLTGRTSLLVSSEVRAEDLVVYNLHVETYHNYFAAGFLVHNKKIEKPMH